MLETIAVFSSCLYFAAIIGAVIYAASIGDDGC